MWGNNRLYWTPLFCRDSCYYLIRKRCYCSENRGMPLKTSIRRLPKFTAASRRTPCDSVASCWSCLLRSLQCVSIACTQSDVLSIVNPSVCLSHVGTVKMTHATVMRSSLQDSPKTHSSFFMVNFMAKFQWEHREWGAEWERGRKNTQFSANKSSYLSQKRWLYCR